MSLRKTITSIYKFISYAKVCFIRLKITRNIVSMVFYFVDFAYFFSKKNKINIIKVITTIFD